MLSEFALLPAKFALASRRTELQHLQLLTDCPLQAVLLMGDRILTQWDSAQEVMHEMKKYAQEGPETAACIEKNMRIVDAYIKVLESTKLPPDAQFLSLWSHCCIVMAVAASHFTWMC